MKHITFYLDFISPYEQIEDPAFYDQQRVNTLRSVGALE